MTDTRIFFVTDVHGSDICFRKFVNASKFYKADTLILGGDITGKGLVPVISADEDRYEYTLFGKRYTVKRKDLGEHLKRIRDSGLYYFMTTRDELAEVEGDRRRQDEIFLEAMRSSIREWISLVDERLKGTDVKCYISLGNDDRPELADAMRDSEHVVYSEGKVVEIKGKYEMLTIGYSNPTPWHAPREVDEDTLASMIDGLAGGIRDVGRSIFTIHIPPYGTELDKAPAVSSELRYEKMGLGMLKMTHAGSTAVLEAMRKYQPLLGLHGHIHESKGFSYIGRTLCINPGSDYGDGTLRGAIVDLEGGRVKDFVLTTG